jgi:hypothetical protein
MKSLRCVCSFFLFVVFASIAHADAICTQLGLPGDWSAGYAGDFWSPADSRIGCYSKDSPQIASSFKFRGPNSQRPELELQAILIAQIKDLRSEIAKVAAATSDAKVALSNTDAALRKDVVAATAKQIADLPSVLASSSAVVAAVSASVQNSLLADVAFIQSLKDAVKK